MLELHEWNQHSGKALQKMEGKEIENCLNYVKFKYDQTEWDNIATVVPRFSLYLEKYLSGISSVCHEFNERETVSQLRFDLEGDIMVTNKTVAANKETDISEKGIIELKASILKRKHGNLK